MWDSMLDPDPPRSILYWAFAIMIAFGAAISYGFHVTDLPMR